MAKIKYNGNTVEVAADKTAIINCQGKKMQDAVTITGACKIEYDGTVKEITANQSAVIPGGKKMTSNILVKVEESDSGESGGESGGDTYETISFDVGNNGSAPTLDKTFTAVKGMTWSEFISSQYNIDNAFWEDGQFVRYKSGFFVTISTSVLRRVTGSEEILDGQYYYLESDN